MISCLQASGVIGVIKRKLQQLANRFVGQGLPKFDYLGDNKKPVVVFHANNEVNLISAFYSRQHGSYMYWADIDGVKVVIPEEFLEESK